MTEEGEAASEEFPAARSTASPRTAIPIRGASPYDAENLVQNALEKIYPETGPARDRGGRRGRVVITG
ncbi:hypothetical protein [Streptosporangium sp. V21-05]|uniref:hypothetical protein n=1 Tax=Streptosporangium sp. V21-05 TaxID=3446115 RepID=UPI003F537801